MLHQHPLPPLTAASDEPFPTACLDGPSPLPTPPAPLTAPPAGISYLRNEKTERDAEASLFPAADPLFKGNTRRGENTIGQKEAIK